MRAYLSSMRRTWHNPFERPLYFSVGLTLAGLTLMTVLIDERYARLDRGAEQVFECGVTSPAFRPPAPASLGYTGAQLRLGAELFRNQCASCHAKNMKDNLTGPALGGVRERWAEFPVEDLRSWIRNSQAMVSRGHPRAEAIWSEWQPTVMTAFPQLSDEDIDAVLAYVELQYMSYGAVVP